MTDKVPEGYWERLMDEMEKAPTLPEITLPDPEFLPLFLRDFSHLIGQEISPGITLLTAPRWSVLTGQWTALANYHGALALIAVTVHEDIPE